MQYAALSAHWRQMLQNGWCVRCLFVGSSSIILIWWINITVYRSVFLSFCVSCRPTSERVSKENCVFHGSDGSSYLVKPRSREERLNWQEILLMFRISRRRLFVVKLFFPPSIFAFLSRNIVSVRVLVLFETHFLNHLYNIII